MAKKIYVGNLSYETTDDDLRSFFSEMGNIVSIKIITDPYTGQSRGFAFIEMETASEASKAISSLNGRELNGKTLRVNEAHDNRNKKFRPNNRRY